MGSFLNSSVNLVGSSGIKIAIVATSILSEALRYRVLVLYKIVAEDVSVLNDHSYLGFCPQTLNAKRLCSDESI